MSKLDSIRIQNLRSLKDTGFINLKPLTILVGRNSVGKSTFARSFPLLRQSCESQKKSPILWYGRLVDFGDFNTSIHKKSTEEGIKFSFNIEMSKYDYINIFSSTRLISRGIQKNIFNDADDTKIKTSISINLLDINSKDPQYTVNIFLLNDYIEFIIKPKSNKIYATINDHTYELEIDDFYKIEQRQILPNIKIDLKQDNSVTSQKKLHQYIDFFIKNNNFLFPILIEKNFKKEINKKDIDKVIDLLHESLLNNYDIKAFQKLGVIEERIHDLKEIYIISNIERILDFYNNSISSFFSQVRYLEPLRATAQRYYRKQELAIDEVDSKGSNIAMFLLENHKHEKLKELINKHFDLEFSTEDSTGHISLHLIMNKDTRETINLADLGVGYSQLLPVILQLWSAVYNNKSEDQGCLVVEQPELHLHPAYQAKIADITVDIINQLKYLDRTYHFIYETHSPHLINRLGELIEEGNLDTEDVQILIFDNESGQTNIIHSNFNEEGILENWPFGFFS